MHELEREKNLNLKMKLVRRVLLVTLLIRGNKIQGRKTCSRKEVAGSFTLPQGVMEKRNIGALKSLQNDTL